MVLPGVRATEQTPVTIGSGNYDNTAAKSAQHSSPVGKENEEFGADHAPKRRKLVPASLQAARHDGTSKEPEELRYHAAGGSSADCPASPGPQHMEACAQRQARHTATAPAVPLEASEQPSHGPLQPRQASEPALHADCPSAQPPHAVCEAISGYATAWPCACIAPRLLAHRLDSNCGGKAAAAVCRTWP